MTESDSRSRIMKEAEILFAQKGFSGTSVREIAKAAEVNIAMISYYFGSKNSLLEAIIHSRKNYLQQKVDELMANEDLTYWAKLELLIDDYVDRFKKNANLHRIIMQEQELKGNPWINDFILEQKIRHYQIIIGFLKTGQDLRELNDDVDLMMMYKLMPSQIKFTMYNEDFLRKLGVIETGAEPTLDDLLEDTKEHIKLIFRKFLKK